MGCREMEISTRAIYKISLSVFVHFLAIEESFEELCVSVDYIEMSRFVLRGIQKNGNQMHLK